MDHLGQTPVGRGHDGMGLSHGVECEIRIYLRYLTICRFCLQLNASVHHLSNSTLRLKIEVISNGLGRRARTVNMSLISSSTRRAAFCLRQHTTKSLRPRHPFSTQAVFRVESLGPDNHYEFFPDTLPHGPPPSGSFAIDVRALRNEFLRKQATAHPDHHPGEHKARAEALSARINDAYKTLSDPLLRAQYILSMRGIDLAGDETAKVEDQELLLEVLEARETIEEAKTESDLAPLREGIERRTNESVTVLEQAFQSDDMQTARIEAIKLRYWMNIQESIRDWEPGKPVVLIH